MAHKQALFKPVAWTALYKNGTGGKVKIRALFTHSPTLGLI